MKLSAKYSDLPQGSRTQCIGGRDHGMKPIEEVGWTWFADPFERSVSGKGGSNLHCERYDRVDLSTSHHFIPLPSTNDKYQRLDCTSHPDFHFDSPIFERICIDRTSSFTSGSDDSSDYDGPLRLTAMALFDED